jgi:origin recognition complex subunit 4
VDDDVSAAKELCRQLSLDGSLPRTRKPSLEHYLRFFLDSLKEGRAGNVPVAIILHNFELFALRAKQTLLYNLFDITQSAKYQVCIIGTSARLDVTELLEKRLRSRFSCRQVLLAPPSLEGVREFATTTLSIDTSVFTTDKANVIAFKQWNGAIASAFSSKAGAALVCSGSSLSMAFETCRLSCRCVVG